MQQDFSGQNLRGRSFKGQNLEGANFSYTDIRSVDFSGANLKGANFSHAKAGLQNRWVILLVCISWLLSLVSGFVSVVAFAFSVAFAFVFAFGSGYNQAVAFAVAVAFAIAFAFILAGAFAFAFIVAGAGAVAVAGVFAFSGAFVLGETFALVFAAGSAGASTKASIEAVAGVFAFTLAVVLLSAFIAWRGMKGDEKYSLIHNSAIALAAFGGTSFRNANLTDVNFTKATLQSTDFRKANLTRTCFNKTKMLDRVRPGTTYLQKALVVSVLIMGQGQNKNFDRLDLRGVNFQEANLVDASFIGADLSEANLQDADLSRAKLVQTQLNGTDFTGSNLTGAYIQDWGITTDTKFDGVRCEYVYMRLPTKENPDPLRKPDNNKEVFADGEFGDFIKPILDTLDLYHNQDVDPRAIAISFKQLAENHPDAELEILAMEKRGEDKFLLRAKTAATADKSELSKEYFDTYNEIKGLPEREIKLLLQEKDSRIRSLENMVMTALQSPKFYAQTETNNSAVKTILIVASNPKNTSQLRLVEEVREIDAGLQRAKKRELFDIKQRWAVRVQDVYQSLLDFKPQIIHFSGHGAGEHGLVLEDDAGNLKLVNTEALAQLFSLFSSTIECVVLNACYSEVQAGAIAKHIPYVIGMNQEIGDKAAIKFATGFYNALGTGESVEFAYKLGCNVIQLDGIPEHLTPVLKKK